MANKRKSILLVAAICVAAIVAVTIVVSGGSEEDPVKHITIVMDLQNSTVEGVKPIVIDPLAERLVEWGYIEGENLELRLLLPGEETLAEQLTNVANDKPDAFFALGLEELALIQAADLGVPVVVQVEQTQLTDELLHQAQNQATDMTLAVVPAATILRLQLLLEIAPDTERLFVPYNTNNDTANAMYADLQAAAPGLGITLQPQPFTDLASERAALRAIPDDADAIFLETSNALLGDWAVLSLQRRIPLAVGFVTDLPSVLLGQGSTLESDYGDVISARLLGQVLNGTDPNEIPVEFAELEFMVSLGAAEVIGVEISDSVLRRASVILRDEVEAPLMTDGTPITELEGFCRATINIQGKQDSVCVTVDCAGLLDGGFVTYSDRENVESCDTENNIGTCVGATRHTYFYTGNPAIFKVGCEFEGSSIWFNGPGVPAE